MRSGIGDPAQLRRLALAPRVAAPAVGELRVDWGVELLLRFRAACPTAWHTAPGGPLGLSLFAFVNATPEAARTVPGVG